MLARFSAAAAVASLAIALGAFTLALMPAVPPASAYRLTLAWCIVPAVWGLWAMLAPQTWVPERLPVWGAFLGAIAGLIAVFILNLPALLFNAQLSTPMRGLGIVLAIVFYYLLWMAVRGACRTLLSGSR